MDQKAPEIAPASKWRIVGIILSGLLVLTVAGAGIWLVLQSSGDSQADRNALLDEITNLKDTGRELQADNQKLQSAAAQPVDDVSVVTKVVRADCEAEVGMQTLSATDFKVNLPFATASVVCTNPQVTTSKKTYEAILKKVNGTWTLISRRSGEATIDKSTRDKYGIPLTIK